MFNFKLKKKRSKTNAAKSTASPTKQYLEPIDGWYQSAPTQFWHEKFQHEIQLVLGKIRMNELHIEIYYQPVVDRLLNLFQAFPASEYNHHSHSGGMNHHVLDVMDIALKYKNKFFWSESGKEIDVEKEADVFAYAVFIACALHDVGKVITDLDVVYKMLDEHSEPVSSTKPWYAQVNPLPQNCLYKYRYNPVRDQTAHVHAAPTMFTTVVPPEGIMWLRKHPKLFQHLMHCLIGDMKGAGDLGEIVRFADSESANKSIMAGTNVTAKLEANVPVASSKKSAADIIVMMIRTAIESDDIRMNAPGGAIWVADDRIYAVSKPTIEKAYNLAVAAGYTSLPQNHVTIYSMLCDAGYAERHPVTRETIHTLQVTVPTTTTEAWKQKLTFLVFKREAIDPNGTLNLPNANMSLEDKTETDGYQAKKKAKEAAANTERPAEETSSNPVQNTSVTPESMTSGRGLSFDNIDIFSEKTRNGLEQNPQDENSPASNPLGHKQGLQGDVSNLSLSDMMKKNDDIVVPTKKIKRPKNKNTNQSSDHKSERRTDTNASVESAKEFNASQVKNSVPPAKKPKAAFDPSKKVSLTEPLSTERQVSNAFIDDRPVVTPVDAPVTQNMSLENHMISSQMNEHMEEQTVTPPTSKEFLSWLDGALQSNLLTINSIEKNCQVYYLVEGIFLCTPSIVDTYNRQNNKQIPSSKIINILKKDKLLQTGMKHIRQVYIGKKNLNGVIIKPDALPYDESLVLATNQYVVVP